MAREHKHTPGAPWLSWTCVRQGYAMHMPRDMAICVLDLFFSCAKGAGHTHLGHVLDTSRTYPGGYYLKGTVLKKRTGWHEKIFSSRGRNCSLPLPRWLGRPTFDAPLAAVTCVFTSSRQHGLLLSVVAWLMAVWLISPTACISSFSSTRSNQRQQQLLCKPVLPSRLLLHLQAAAVATSPSGGLCPFFQLLLGQHTLLQCCQY